MFLSRRPSISLAGIDFRGTGNRKSVNHRDSQRKSTASANLKDTSSAQESQEEILEKNLKETQDKLMKSVEMLSNLEIKFAELHESNQQAKKIALDMKTFSLTAIWGFCTQHCQQFKHIPPVDEMLMEISPYIGNHLTVDEVVGTGRFSHVYSCKQGREESRVAVKSIAKEKVLVMDDILKIEGEIKALVLLKGHKNIVEFKSCLHGIQNLYIITELLPTDLFEFIDSYRQRLDENAIGYILREIIEGISHMHSRNMVHLDLKPENILVAVRRHDIQVKLCDFGLSRIVAEDSSQLTGFIGSPGFFAPEILLQTYYCGYQADMFSLGCVALELLVQKKFFANSWQLAYSTLSQVDVAEFSRKIRNAVINANSEIERCAYSIGVVDFIGSTIHMAPGVRLNAIKARCHPWITHTNKLTAADVINNKEPRKPGTYAHMNSPQILLSQKKISLETSSSPASNGAQEEHKDSGEQTNSTTGHTSGTGNPQLHFQNDSSPTSSPPKATSSSGPTKLTFSTAEGPGKQAIPSSPQEPRKLSQSAPGERKMSFVAGGFAGLLNLAGRKLSITNQSPKIFMTTGGVTGVSTSGFKDGTSLPMGNSSTASTSHPPTKALFPASFSMIPKAALSPNKSPTKSTTVPISAKRY